MKIEPDAKSRHSFITRINRYSEVYEGSSPTPHNTQEIAVRQNTETGSFFSEEINETKVEGVSSIMGVTDRG